MTLKHIIFLPLNRLVNIGRKIFWHLDCFQLRNSILSKELPSIPSCVKSIILIPHADDEWVGCSSIVKSNENVILCNMDMLGGDNDLLHKERFEEIQSIANEYSKSLVTVSEGKTEFLSKLINDERPEIIYLPFFFDWHPEHIETMNILREALIGCGSKLQIAMYQVSIPIPREYITHVHAMTKEEWKFKWHKFKLIYRSQLRIPYERFSINERVNGALCGSYAAESFVVCSSIEWLMNMDTWLLCSKEINQIKQNLQKIKYVNILVDIFKSTRIWNNLK